MRHNEIAQIKMVYSFCSLTDTIILNYIFFIKLRRKDNNLNDNIARADAYFNFYECLLFFLNNFCYVVNFFEVSLFFLRSKKKNYKAQYGRHFSFTIKFVYVWSVFGLYKFLHTYSTIRRFLYTIGEKESARKTHR